MLRVIVVATYQQERGTSIRLGAPAQQFDENGFLITDAYAANMAKGGENPLAGFDMDPNAMMNSAIRMALCQRLSIQ